MVLIDAMVEQAFPPNHLTKIGLAVKNAAVLAHLGGHKACDIAAALGQLKTTVTRWFRTWKKRSIAKALGFK